MEAITELIDVDFSSVFTAVFLILIGLKAMVPLLEWAVERLGLETKWMRKKREEHALLISTSKSLVALQETHASDMQKSDRHDDALQADIKKLTAMFVDKQIDDMRYEILDFSSSLSSGRLFHQEAFDHIMKIYHKYEKILEENNLENGLVEESIKFIQEKYHETLKNGATSCKAKKEQS